MMRHIITIILLAASLVTAAQTVDTRTHIFDPKVKSLRVAPTNNQYLPPIYVLGSDQQLNVNFDVLDPDAQYLRYSVTHCDALWQPSQLIESEYVDGFNEADIEDFLMSEATFVNYFNYNFTIPNNNFQITKSGNYLLKVYRQDDPDAVLFQTRFCVSENTVTVLADVTSRTDEDYNNRHQQVSFEVVTRQGMIADPYNELTAVVTQNSRTDNAVVVRDPMMVSGGKIIYDHNRSLIFPAGNEYRRFETVSVNYMNKGVAEIRYFEPYYHATVYTDEPRAASQYLYDQTQHGRFTIRNAEAPERSDIQGDYMVTHFTLDTDGQRITNGRIFLQGEMTDGLPLSDCMMKWDDTSGLYTCNLLLKQGHYNYQYLWVPDGTAIGQTSLIEGDKYQTINEYVVKVYDRPFGERYDHLIGHAIIFSGK